MDDDRAEKGNLLQLDSHIGLCMRMRRSKEYTLYDQMLVSES